MADFKDFLGRKLIVIFILSLSFRMSRGSRGLSSLSETVQRSRHVQSGQGQLFPSHHRTGGIRDDPWRMSRTNGEGHGYLMDVAETDEEERYVPVSINVEDYDGNQNGNGNGLMNGHAIELMAPVEVNEYGWNPEESRGLSELERGTHQIPNADSRELLPISGSRESYHGSGASGSTTGCGRGDVFDPALGGLCCNGLLYRKSEDGEGKCCGSVAYDARFFTCCQGRAIVRKTPGGVLPLCCGDYSLQLLPDQCRAGYEHDRTGLGSTCCQSGGTASSSSSGWQCCLKGESCCRGRQGAIDVPGFRPACCRLGNNEQTAQCCASTYERMRILPDCCDSEQLTPVCCRRQDGTIEKCCPGTISHCCGQDSRLIPTDRPAPWHPSTDPRFDHTRAPIYPTATHRPIFTYPPRPSQPAAAAWLTHAPRATYQPRPIYTTKSSGQQPFEDRRSMTRPDGSHGDPGRRDDWLRQGTTALAPSCCSGKPVRQCSCTESKRPPCCRSVQSQLPRCCIVVYFNAVCCRVQLQQQHQSATPGSWRSITESNGGHLERQSDDSRIKSGTNHDVAPLSPPSESHDRPLADDPGNQHRRGTYSESNFLRTRVRNGEIPPYVDSDLRMRNGKDPSEVGRRRGRIYANERQTKSSNYTDRSRLLGQAILTCCGLGNAVTAVCCRDSYLAMGGLPSCCGSDHVERQSSPLPPVGDLTKLEKNSNLITQQELHLAVPPREPVLLGGETALMDEEPAVTRRLRRVVAQNPVMVSDSAKGSGSKCDGTTFNAQEYICCNNTLRRLIGVSPACCNNVAFDQLLYKCCDGRVRISCRIDYTPKKSVWGVLV